MMDNNYFIVLVLICISAHMVRSTYEILKHKKIVKASKLTFVIIFVNMGILWMSWFTLCGIDVYSVNLPDIVRYVGVMLFGIGVLVFFWALFTIKALESYAGDLMTKGIYSKIRHPMYLGFILWLIGLPIFYGGLLSFILSFLFVANVLFWRYLEEKELEQRYSAYLDYRKSTIF